MATYQIGDKPKVQATFTLDDVNTDPDAVTVTVIAPDGTRSNPTPTNSATGIYSVLISLAAAGFYHVRFKGSGTVDAVGDTSIQVENTIFD